MRRLTSREAGGLLAVTLLVLAAAAVQCGDGPPLETRDASWPPPPDAAPASTTSTVVYALDSVDFGDRAKGSPLLVGLDLDGKNTTAHSTDVCTLPVNAPVRIQVDGRRSNEVGIDNSFVANVLPALDYLGEGLAPAQPMSSAAISTFMQKGGFTLQVEVTGLDPTDPSQSNVGLIMQSFASTVFDLDGGTPPLLLPTQDWPVRSDIVVDASALPLRSRETFVDSYVNHGTFVSGRATLTFGFMVPGWSPMDLHIHAALIVMNVHGDDVDGTLGGVLDATELTSLFHDVEGVFSPYLCGDTSMDSLIAQAQDIMIDGTNPPGMLCNGISFGMRFTGKRIATPVRVEAPPSSSSCPGEGEDASGPCLGSRDCADAQADAADLACCKTLVLDSTCAIETIESVCEARSSCSTSGFAGCGATFTARGCASAADCDEPAYPKCCLLPAPSNDMPYVCMSTSFATLSPYCR